MNATDVGNNLTDFEIEFRFTAITDEVSLTCVGSATYHNIISQIGITGKIPVVSKVVYTFV